MGLSGRKVKQRIGHDPRNLSWADDAARFGSNYLSKFGWDASKGLGAEGEGRTSHVKVLHKLDMLGIGAAQQRDPNGIAWKQNKDFENLLKRLNESEGQEGGETSAAVGVVEDSDRTEDVPEESKKKKKRSHKDGEDGEERKKKKRKAVIMEEESESPALEIVQVVEVKKMPTSLPRHRSHRARAIAAKNISSKSAAHISEILGIAPTPTTSSGYSSGVQTPMGKLTSVSDTDALDGDKITTSTKSVTEYFMEKMKARSAPGTPSESATPPSDNDAYDAPRMGLRASSRATDAYDAPRIGLGSSRLRFEVQSADEETQRLGLSKFSSLMSSSFLAATSTSFSPASASFVVPAVQDEEQESTHDAASNNLVEQQPDTKTTKKDKTRAGGETAEKKEKKLKKDKKGKAKAEKEMEMEMEEEESGVDGVEGKKRKEKKTKKRRTGNEDEDNVDVVEVEEVVDSSKKKKRKNKPDEVHVEAVIDSQKIRKEKKKKSD